MVPGLTTSSYSVLGLLSIGSMSGYDLHIAANRSVGRFWSIPKTQVYSELSKLELLGLVEASDVRQEKLPDKRVFHITGSGEEALDAWLDQPESGDLWFRAPFVIKAFFGHRRRPPETADLLEQAGRAAAARAQSYAAFLELLMEVPDSGYPEIAVLFGVRMNQAVAAWAEEAKGLLPEKRYRVNPRENSEKVKALFRSAPNP
jgi:PadR family transcriptional regulator, regulatory protein AphA